MFNMNKLTGAALGASLFMGVWGAPVIANDMSSAESYQALIQAAVDNPLRDDKDRERDTGRKPAKIIEFMGIKPGMTVMEMLAGSGYYAEILSHVVGETGKVIALNNKSYMAFTKDAIVTRLEQPGRMENVDLKIAEINEMDLKKDNLDAVFLVLSYHDFYFVDEESGWPKVDVKRTLGQIHGALKQGGTLAVIDHAAAAGSPRETGSTLHRIDPAIVRTELEAAGFELVATSDVLANPQDDLSKPMYDKSVRGKTHRFVYRFVKK
tara:strand:- start:3161 stop:3958 length:798 start_codon:yes stop_codon:yes gene_type:complete